MSMEINEMQEMNERAKKALEYHKKGYNCSQAVACSFCEEFGVDEETMFRMTEGLGLGMGGMEGTCGAITGAVAVIGAIKSCGDIEKPVSKAATYKLSGELVKRFQEKNQATKCKDLKGIETGKVLRSCPGCIEDATAILEEILAE
jgi:C_GCAxxG_C_C family probable redox protein